MKNALLALTLLAMSNPAFAGGDYYDDGCGCAAALASNPTGLGLLALVLIAGLTFARRRC